MSMEEIIRSLSPELQEKAKACKSPEELIALGREHAAELTPEALEAIAGGTGSSVKSCGKVKCPKCGSTNVTVTKEQKAPGWVRANRTCNDCGYTWHEDYYYN